MAQEVAVQVTIAGAPGSIPGRVSFEEPILGFEEPILGFDDPALGIKDPGKALDKLAGRSWPAKLEANRTEGSLKATLKGVPTPMRLRLDSGETGTFSRLPGSGQGTVSVSQAKTGGYSIVINHEEQ